MFCGLRAPIKLSATCELEESIIVDVPKRSLVSRINPAYTRHCRHIVKPARPTVPKQNRVVFPAKRCRAVNGRKKQIQTAIIVDIRERRTRIRLLIKHPTRPKVIKHELARRTRISQEARLWLVSPTVDMRKVAGKEVEPAIVVDVTPGGPDRVTAIKPLGCRNSPTLRC